VAKKESVLERRVSFSSQSQRITGIVGLRSSHISPFVSWGESARGGGREEEEKTPHPFFFPLPFFRTEKEERKTGEREKKKTCHHHRRLFFFRTRKRECGVGVLNVVLKFEPKNSFKTPGMRGHI
jgi:hypothetical protein